jgi:5-methyltetrahydropteroyltriglutamate--homocysteine methyltransferase
LRRPTQQQTQVRLREGSNTRITRTNFVEHHDIVADRIVRFAEAVSRENVVASTDCGLSGRVHPQIAWAKLDTLVKGAELATSQL